MAFVWHEWRTPQLGVWASFSLAPIVNPFHSRPRVLSEGLLFVRSSFHAPDADAYCVLSTNARLPQAINPDGLISQASQCPHVVLGICATAPVRLFVSGDVALDPALCGHISNATPPYELEDNLSGISFRAGDFTRHGCISITKWSEIRNCYFVCQYDVLVEAHGLDYVIEQHVWVLRKISHRELLASLNSERYRT